jgi:hypothetical protein
MNTVQEEAHARMLRELPVRTVHRDIEDRTRPAKAWPVKNHMVLAAEREAQVLMFMKPGIRYTAFEIGAVADLDYMATYNLIARLLKRGRLVRHGKVLRGHWYSKR